jgi:predicted phosphoadenosine phosphosulfate sulfurtransferase
MQHANRVFLKDNVYQAAVKRIAWILDEFQNVYVSYSGGKDSTVILGLTLQVAEQKNRLPINVIFVDQEGEWQATIDLMRIIMNDPRVIPHWLQVPVRIFNAASYNQQWLDCWNPDRQDEWIRPKEPNSIHHNTFGTDRFVELLDAYARHQSPKEKLVSLTGLRAEEAPQRTLGLTVYETYKGETWGSKRPNHPAQYTMSPIYDWTYRDVWKAIHENRWPYNKLYDAMYQYGVSIRNMRVSNLNHETALESLTYAQEVEPHTWNKMTKRLQGVNTVGILQKQRNAPSELPYMFNTWREYRDHLLHNLITDPTQKRKYQSLFTNSEKNFKEEVHDKLIGVHIAMILVNDYHGTKLSSFKASNSKNIKNAGKHSGRKTFT